MTALRSSAKRGKYIRDFERLAMQTTTARELYDEMLKVYPDGSSGCALEFSARRKNLIILLAALHARKASQ